MRRFAGLCIYLLLIACGSKNAKSSTADHASGLTASYIASLEFSNFKRAPSHVIWHDKSYERMNGAEIREALIGNYLCNADKTRFTALGCEEFHERDHYISHGDIVADIPGKYVVLDDGICTPNADMLRCRVLYRADDGELISPFFLGVRTIGYVSFTLRPLEK